MTTSITITPEYYSSSPGQAGKPKPPSHLVNDDFISSFADVLDMINPLQHIPIVSTVYRALTQDTIAPGPRIVGDTLFGGPIGLIGGIINSIAENTTGRDIGSNVLALINEEKAAQLASAAYEQTSNAVSETASSATDELTIADLYSGLY